MSKDYEAPVCPFCQGEMWPVVVPQTVFVAGDAVKIKMPYWECHCEEFPDDIELGEP